MTIYVVLSDGVSAKLKANIETHFPGDAHFDVAAHQWLIATDKVDQTVSDELEITDGRAEVRAVVFRIAGTGFGWHSKAMWEWLAVKDQA